MALYGDPADDDTLDGRTLIVSTSGGSAAIGGPRIGIDPERIDVGNRRGVLVHDGDRTWFSFDTDRQDYVEFVGARGLTDDEVLAAAAGAVFAGPSESIGPEALPSDLRPLSSSARIDCGEMISLGDGRGAIWVNVVRAEPRLASVWGWWVRDRTGAAIRGRPGSAGTLHGTALGDQARIWAENGVVISVIGRDADPAALDAVTAALRPGSAAEFARMQESLLAGAPTAKDVGCPTGAAVVSARDVTTERVEIRWVTALGVDPTSAASIPWQCNDLIYATGSSGVAVARFSLGGPARLTLPASRSLRQGTLVGGSRRRGPSAS
ncbi:MAG: hypothetical protein H0T85_00770 [Geodermatophilaceae bacterium]|nr:hypothetical protein [Geodermatophilaceae bacterium]